MARRSAPDRRCGRACRRRRFRCAARSLCARPDSRAMRARSRARLSPGLRACTGLSRHSSVVSSSPRPLTSMLPPSSTRPGCHCAHLQTARELRGDRIVLLPVVVLGPAVEAPVGDGDFARRAAHKDRAIVAGPDTIGRTRERIQPRPDPRRLFAGRARAPCS